MISPHARSLALLFTANVLFAAGLHAHAFLYNFYLEALGFAEGSMGVAAAALTAGSLIALAPAGVLVDRRGPKPVFVFASLVLVAGLAAGALAERTSAIYAAALVAGLGTGAWQVAGAPAIMALAPERSRARAFSLNVALLIGSGSVWTAGAGWLTDALRPILGGPGVETHRWTLLAGAALSLAAVPLFLALPSMARASPPREPLRSAHRPAALALPRPLILMVGLVTLWMVGAAVVQPFFNLYFQRVHGMSIAGIGGLFAVSHAIVALVVVGSGELASRIGALRVMGGWVVVFVASLGGIALTTLTPLAITLFIFFGFVGPGTNPLIDQILQERAPSGKRGVLSTWRNAAAGVSGLIGATVGGWILQLASFGVLFGGAAALGGVAGAGLILGARRLGFGRRGDLGAGDPFIRPTNAAAEEVL
jgi:MFS family permease